jgi:hypothetical protein
MLYSVLVIQCALRAGSVLAAMIAGFVDRSVKSGQCSSSDNSYSYSIYNHRNYCNVINKNTSNDIRSASTGNPRRSLIISLIPVLSLGATPHIPPTTDYGILVGKVDTSSRHVLVGRHLQYTLI